MSPENYITNSKSSELCDELLLLDPEKPGHTPFKPDDETLDKIDQAFEREEKVLFVGEKAICIENSYAHLEQIKMAHKALYSPVYEATANGFIASHQRRNKKAVEKLERAQALPLSPFTPVVTTITPAQSSDSSTQPLATLHDLSDQGLEDQILKSNATYLQKAANYIRKTLTDPLGYLTDQKSGTVADTILLFNPQLPNAVEFNQSMELHRELVHNAFERQNRFRYQVQYYLRTKNYDGIRVLSEKTHRGYRSLLTAIIIRASLKYAESTKKNENAGTSQTIEFAIPDTVTCKCAPTKFLKNCDSCKKNLFDKLNATCDCKPAQLLKNCSKCREILQKSFLQPLPPPATSIGKNSPPNLDGQCNCDQQKTLKNCNECMAKLLQEQYSASSLASSTSSQQNPLAQSAAAASSSSSISIHKPLPPVPPKPKNVSDNSADNNSSN